MDAGGLEAVISEAPSSPARPPEPDLPKPRRRCCRKWFSCGEVFVRNLGVRGDVATQLVREMQFFPMKFKDPLVEREFSNLCIQLYPLRMRIYGCLAALIVVVLWLFIGLRLELPEAFSVGEGKKLAVFETSQIICFHALQSVIFVGCLVLFFASIRENVYYEVVTYAVLLTSGVTVVAFTLFGVFKTPLFDMRNLSNDVTVRAAINLKAWTDSYFVGNLFIQLLILDCYFPTRTRYSLIFHIYLFIVFGGTYAITAYRFAKQSQFLTSLSIQIFICLVTITMGFGGRYLLEISDRAAALELFAHQNRLRQLEDQVRGRREDSGSSTAVEDIIAMVKESQALFTTAQLSGSADDFLRAKALLDNALSVLTRSVNLYTVQLHGGVGADDISRRFMELYADGEKNYLRGGVGRAGTLADRFARGDIRHASVAAYGLPTSLVAGIFPERKMELELFRIAGYEWDLNLFQINSLTQHVLMEVGFALLEYYVPAMKTTMQTLQTFLLALESQYYPNPYHNALHGAAVGHMATTLARFLGILEEHVMDPLDVVSLIVATLAHDVGHPGKNNAFLVASYNPIAVLYNDRAPLENFHSCLLFKIIEPDESNILMNIDYESFQFLRKNIITMILATDMKNHFEFASMFRVRRNAPDFNLFKNKDDLWQTLQIIVKAADLGHAAVDWDQHVEWSMRVTEEFYQQGEAEKDMGLPISPLCDRGKHTEFPKSQHGFIEFVVQPLFKELEQIDPGGPIGMNVLRRLLYNRYKWDELHRFKVVLPLTEKIRAIKTKDLLLMGPQDVACFAPFLLSLNKSSSEEEPAECSSMVQPAAVETAPVEQQKGSRRGTRHSRRMTSRLNSGDIEWSASPPKES